MYSFKITLKEFNKNVFQILDLIGLYYILEHWKKWTTVSRSNYIIRILAVAIGWSFAENMFSHIFYLLYNVRGIQIIVNLKVRNLNGNIC